MLSKSLKIALFVVVAICTSLDSAGANAQAATSIVVFSQPQNATGRLLQSSWWDPDGSNYDRYVWDSFTLQSNHAITEIRWSGGYDPARLGYGGQVLDFTVAIHASIAAGTEPDVIKPPLVKYRTRGNAGQVRSGTFGGVEIYDYAIILPTPFLALAGTKYWVQIEAFQHGIPDWGFAAATGDGSHFRRIFYISDKYYQKAAGDAAFTLLASESPIRTRTFRSIGSYDGWIADQAGIINQGGPTNSSNTLIRIGDSATNQQYRGFLSFDTSSLPNSAQILSAKIQIRKQGTTGGDPFTTHQSLVADIGKPFFSGDITLQPADFNATAKKNLVGTFEAVPGTTSWYSASLNISALPYISRSAPTQFRLRFLLHDDDDAVSDYVRFYSGNYATADSQPRLRITYIVP